MQLSPDIGEGSYHIRACEDNKIFINDDIQLTESCVIMPEFLLKSWPVTSSDALTNSDFAIILQQKPEIILLGTGPGLSFPPAAIMAHLQQQRIGFEAMSNSAACRTYSVLMAEGRLVACALILGH